VYRGQFSAAESCRVFNALMLISWVTEGHPTPKKFCFKTTRTHAHKPF